MKSLPFSDKLPIWLASNSPRRAALLEQIQVPYRILHIPAQMDVELTTHRAPTESIEDFALKIVTLKNKTARDLIETPYPILTADTLVILDGAILSKPSSLAEAHEMLMSLSDQTHRVITAVALSLAAGHIDCCLAETHVTFKRLTPTDIERYLRCCQVLDKAGAYAIQEYAACFIAQIQGNYSTVVGLPLFELNALFEKWDIPTGIINEL